MPIASPRSGEDERAALLSPDVLPLFNDRFIRSCDLIEEYTARLTLEIFRSTGLEKACADAVSVDEVLTRIGLAPDVARVPVGWMLAMLSSRGWIERHEDGDRYRLRGPLPAFDPREMLDAQIAHDPSALPSYRIAALAAELYPSVLRGDITGEDALFAPDNIGAWFDYFSNANPLYAINNMVGAMATMRALPEGASILELGGGLGSAAEAVLERIETSESGAKLAAYRFTEISPPFLRRAKKSLSARFPRQPLAFAWLDINRPFAEAGVAPGAYSIVYGVNVLHVAHDLAATLGEIRTALAPKGKLIIAECVRPWPDMPLYVEFVFNLLQTFREPLRVQGWRPNGGFLTPEQWSAALQNNGFTDVRIAPDIAALRADYPAFAVASISAKRGE